MGKNLRRQHPPGAEIWPSEIVEFGWVNISRVSSVVSGPKFTDFVSSSVVEIVGDNGVSRLSIH